MNAFHVRPEVEALEDRCVLSTAPPAYLAAVANGVTHGSEYYFLHENMDYSFFLHRPASTAEANAWAGALQAGAATLEQVDAGLTSSPEYVQKHGGAYNATWVQNLYSDFLRRSASAAEANNWVGAVQAGLPPLTAAYSIAAGPEREARVVTALYSGLLLRLPGTAEVNAWVQNMPTGVHTETVQAALIASAEYAGRFSSSPAWLTQLYIDALNRQPSPADYPGWLGAYNVGYNPTVWAVKAINEPTLAASYDDINQSDSSSTCYILAPLSAAALKGMNLAGPDRVRYLGNNQFQVKLYDDANSSWFWQTTVYNGVPAATDPVPSSEGDYWPILYQHAYVDRWAGGDPKQPGYANLALVRLTGRTNYEAKYVTGTNDFWTLYNHPNQPAVVRCNTTDAARGLMGFHFYTLVGVGIDAAHGSTWYLTLRNPFGQDTYNDWINSFYSYTADYRYHDGIDDLFSDGLIRVTWTTFTTDFNYYAISWYNG